MKKILIIDEKVFSKICSAILEMEGLLTEILEESEHNLGIKCKIEEFGLIIMSFPFTHKILKEIKEINLPTIVLTDQINKDLINLLESLTNSYCMIKPIDYEKFKFLAKKLVTSGLPCVKGYNLV
ncbi:MAG: DNA-binding response regulator [Nitrospirota bacterium]